MKKKIVVSVIAVVGLLAVLFVAYSIGFGRGENFTKDLFRQINHELDYDIESIEGVWLEHNIEPSGEDNYTNFVRFTVDGESISKESTMFGTGMAGEIEMDAYPWDKVGVLDGAFYNYSTRSIPFLFTPDEYTPVAERDDDDKYEVYDEKYNSYYSAGVDFDTMVETRQESSEDQATISYYIRMPLKKGRPYFDLKDGEQLEDYTTRKLGLKFIN